MQLIDDLVDARARTLSLVDGLTDEQWVVPQLEIVNPPLWEVGHVAWFQERWTLRELAGEAPFAARADELYDSIEVHHGTRWDLALPPRADTMAYAKHVLDAVVERLRSVELSPREEYFHRLATYHEDMHAEAFAYTRQTLGHPAPPRHGAVGPVDPHRACPGDVEVAGGGLVLGGAQEDAFVFDNEKWGHEVEVAPFRIARGAVTQADFAEFVDAGGYAERAHWCDEGWRWRVEAGAEHPAYWERGAGGAWYRRHFDHLVVLEELLPVHHVNWFEASAYCRWAGRRLPTEAEWEFAASVDGDSKRRFPWGDDAPSAAHAHLDGRGAMCLSVGALPEGDSPWGCRQMMGNVWEWTASTFEPYPGFVVDPYKDYSEPWFGTRKVLRGGCHATRARMLRNTWRNFFTPDRRDVFAGFRTCAL